MRPSLTRQPLLALRAYRPSLLRMCLATLLLSLAGSAGAVVPAPIPSCYRSTHTAVFPLRVSDDRRHLADSENRPFLLTGDAAWSLIAGLTRENAEIYLKDRHCRGFNTIIVSLIEHKFVNDAPRNAYGIAPFRRASDFSMPNDLYFRHAKWIVGRAENLGILVLLAPAYLGVGGGDEGWYHVMKANGATKLRRYGEYVGRLFAHSKNIVWVHAGDYNPPERRLVTAIEDGIRKFDTRSLRTAHAGPETSARSYWADQPWLNLDTIYSYQPIQQVAANEYNLSRAMPFILIESAYENEHGASEQRLRAQAYEALLGGACGQIFGNNPVWHFNGPGLFEGPGDWQQQLASRGANSMIHLRQFFEQHSWWDLVPNESLIFDASNKKNRPSAALSRDRAFAVAYAPNASTLSVDFRQMSGRKVSGEWFDPSSGATEPARPIASDAESADFKAPSQNSAGDSDWILVLQSGPVAARRPEIDTKSP